MVLAQAGEDVHEVDLPLLRHLPADVDDDPSFRREPQLGAGDQRLGAKVLWDASRDHMNTVSRHPEKVGVRDRGILGEAAEADP